MATLINCKIENFIEKQYVGEQKIENAYIGSSQHETPAPPTQHAIELASLAKYIPEPDRVEDIAAQLATVGSAQDFKMVVSRIAEMYTPADLPIIITQDFRNALKPFLVAWAPKDDTIYRHCHEVLTRSI